MKPILEFESDHGTILIQSSDEDPSIVTSTSRLDDAVNKLSEKLEEKARVIAQLGETVMAAVSNTIKTAESIEVEFGIAFTLKGTIYVVESSAAATFKVKLTGKPNNG